MLTGAVVIGRFDFFILHKQQWVVSTLAPYVHLTHVGFTPKSWVLAARHQRELGKNYI